jgi:hypothetical protein
VTVPEIEFVTLANYAEALNGLLYLQGAGWTEVRTPMGPQGQIMPVHLGVGISILIGWNETNVSYPVRFEMVHEDGGEPVLAGDGQVESGRPPGAMPGAELRNVIALSAQVVFPRPGGYTFRVTLADKAKQVTFRVTQFGPPPSSTGMSGPSAIPGLS